MVAAGRYGAKRSLIAATLISAAIGLSGAAYGSVITSVPVGGMDYTFPDSRDFTDHPEFYWSKAETIFPGVTWSSDVTEGSLYGVAVNYGLTENNNWIGTPAVALDYSKGTMTIAFSNPVAAVGGFINWSSKSTALIAILDQDRNVLEFLHLSNLENTPDSFYGFSISANLISYFTLSDDFIGMRTLTTATITPTPLPGALPLFIGGLGAIGLLGWRRRSKTAA